MIEEDIKKMYSEFLKNRHIVIEGKIPFPICAFINYATVGQPLIYKDKIIGEVIALSVTESGMTYRCSIDSMIGLDKILEMNKVSAEINLELK